MIKEYDKYEEWLITIANTRLIYNTMDELEDMLDNHSIHNNGIKRCFASSPKMRAAFRDLKVEVSLMTDENVTLDRFLERYKKTWTFYKTYLSRRADPEKTAMEILCFCCPPYNKDGYGKKKSAIYHRIEEEDISIPILVMLLMKVLPGYDSKDGDVINMPQHYETVMSLLEKYTNEGTMFSILPTITKARGEQHKSRIMLYHYICEILNTFESYSDTSSLYDTSNNVKETLVNIDIEGIWNECSGSLLYTSFWQIEKALNEGTYFVTYWHKNAENRLTGIKYTWFLSEAADGSMIVYVIHPEAIKHRMKGLAYGDSDNVWYKTEMPKENPSMLSLHRLMASNVWPLSISLTKVTDQTTIDIYSNWMNSCSQELLYSDCDYTFYPNLHAITEDYLYIPTEVDGEYFKIPKNCHEGFDKIQFGDNVGTMHMNNQLYLAFDEFLLYISTSRNSLKKYGIKKVNQID
ncbi:MAG: hypothetical protein MJZ73_02625 [Bacteroidaceae bacterium]|nr:hypothetical protein [Bacteroidaceae bacterium]